jgi:hypothetical protein
MCSLLEPLLCVSYGQVMVAPGLCGSVVLPRPSNKRGAEGMMYHMDK